MATSKESCVKPGDMLQFVGFHEWHYIAESDGEYFYHKDDLVELNMGDYFLVVGRNDVLNNAYLYSYRHKTIIALLHVELTGSFEKIA